MQAGTTYAITPTLEEIVRECDDAWEYARKKRAQYKLDDAPSSESESEPAHSEEQNMREENIYMELAQAHVELNKTYPVILAAMAAGSYSSRAASKFFTYVKNHPWRTEEEFLDVQSAYNPILYRATHPHVNTKAVARVRENVRNALQENQRMTKEQIEAAQRAADINNAARAKQRVADILARIPRDARILTQDERRPIIVTFDDY